MTIKPLHKQAIQAIMHYYGLETFKELLRQVALDCSDEMKDIDLEISMNYTDFSQKIEMIDEEAA